MGKLNFHQHLCELAISLLWLQLIDISQSLFIVDDNRTTWQVSEGLGSVAFSEENFDESIEFFKKALGVLAAKESNITAQSRIVEKLKQALEAQIKEREKPFGHITKEVGIIFK